MITVTDINELPVGKSLTYWVGDLRQAPWAFRRTKDHIHKGVGFVTRKYKINGVEYKAIKTDPSVKVKYELKQRNIGLGRFEYILKKIF